MGGTICTSRKPEQVGKALLWLPYWIVNKMIDSVISAEAKLGKPPNVIQIFMEMKERHTLPVNTIYEGAAVLMSLFREDWLYADDICQHYSLTRHSGFENFTEKFNKWGKGYKLARDGTVIADTARTVNFNVLWQMLRSKDESSLAVNKWIFDDGFKLLDGQKLPHKVAFNGYPRSGTTFLRKYIEQITGLVTGATVMLHTATSLQITGLKGEFIADDRCWIVKAHHPILLPGVLKFKSNKVFCCVRNPLDVIVSLASLGNTMSHSARPEFCYTNDYPEWWKWWVQDQAIAHKKYFESMLRHCNEERQNPIYFVRYEDLIENPKQELEGIMKFLLDLDDLSGTNCERRIQEVIKMGATAAQSYKLKPTTGKFNAFKDKYSEEQIKHIQELNADLLYYFGYTNSPTNEVNKTAFFEFKDHKPEHAAKYYGYREQNKKWCKELNEKGGWKEPLYEINGHKDCFDFQATQELIQKVQEPARDYAKKQFEAAAKKKEQVSVPADPKPEEKSVSTPKNTIKQDKVEQKLIIKAAIAGAQGVHVDKLETVLSNKQWIGGAQPTSEDYAALESLNGQAPDPVTHPHVFGWYSLASKFVENIKKSWPQSGSSLPTKDASIKAVPQKKEKKQAPVKVEAKIEENKKEEPNKEVKKADDEDFDPFADDEPEDEEAEKARMERMKALAKPAKQGLIAKSLVIWEVKPWGEETDLDVLGKKICEIKMDGLTWKTEFKKEPIAYGVSKIVIGAVVEDAKVSTDIVEEKIMEFEHEVQSVDIQIFNKL